jgi:hypothetical protein
MYISHERLIASSKIDTGNADNVTYDLYLAKWVRDAEIQLSSTSMKVRKSIRIPLPQGGELPSDCVGVISVEYNKRLAVESMSQLTSKPLGMFTINGNRVNWTGTPEGTVLSPDYLDVQYMAFAIGDDCELLIPMAHEQAIVAFLNWRTFQLMAQRPERSNLFRSENTWHETWMAQAKLARVRAWYPTENERANAVQMHNHTPIGVFNSTAYRSPWEGMYRHNTLYYF